MDKDNKINIALKFAEIDDKPYSDEYAGWVSRLVDILSQTLEFYFGQPPVIHLKKETDLISEKEFKALDAIIYVFSPAFIFSSNLSVEISAIEKAVLFDTDYLNSKIHKVLKGPINVGDLPVTISMGTFHYFYQTANSGDSNYETLFDWDTSAAVRSKYWESFTNLLFNLLKYLKHKKAERFIPPNKQTFYLGTGDISQLWNRTKLLGELNCRGVKVFPDHDHSIEVKHLKEPVKFYLKKSNLAIHFPEEFLPLDGKKLQDLAELSWLKRYIWFDPEAEKELDKKKLHDELKQKLKNLDHVEVVSSGLEELKEIIFANSDKSEDGSNENETASNLKLYLICSEDFPKAKRNEIMELLRLNNIDLLLLDKGMVHDRRAKHYQYLKEADFCLICYEGNNPDWVFANINEVKKSSGLNPEKRRKIKLGLLLGNEGARAELNGISGAVAVFSASSPSLQEGINFYLNEK